MSSRPPAIAGTFYPADPEELRRAVSIYVGDAVAAMRTPKALIAPHAGYVYSGAVAGHAYRCLEGMREQLSRVILLGPAHTVYLQGMAVPSVDTFVTPMGEVAIDHEVIETLSDLPQVLSSDEAHQREHSLEVHLPFLQSVLGDFTLVPFVVGETHPDQVAEVLERLWGGDETLIVVSSDLSHFHDYASAQEKDRATSAAIEAFRSGAIGPQQACGCYSLNGLLQLAARREMDITTLALANSGDTVGPRDRVVGYGAYGLR
jgi:AmmeMemoRadiSam system protein B